MKGPSSQLSRGTFILQVNLLGLFGSFCFAWRDATGAGEVLVQKGTA